MDFKVLITDAAINDLQEIVAFIAENDAYAAMRFGERLLDHAQSLRLLPGRFPLHDRRRGIRKMPVGSYLIFYLMDEVSRTVKILHFWHGGRKKPF